jgi:4-diphosphocytidyl-2-C-methyl-D-erythritol kinase
MIASLVSKAKVNLFLNVCGKREDGMHIINSVFAPLTLADEIIISKSDELIVKTINAQITKNNVEDVLTYFYNHFQLPYKLEIVINKKIPIASGLGGSSTNAATIISFMNAHFDLALSYDQLKAIAIKFGADTVYFLEPKVAFVGGIGDSITEIKLHKQIYILIVSPNFPILAKDCYSMGFDQYTKAMTMKEIDFNHILNGKNDLQVNAFKIMKDLDYLISELKNCVGCICARLSGSGSAFFGLFETLDAAENAKMRFSKNYNCFYHLQLLNL